MPLKPGTSKKTVSYNIGELMHTKPSASRAKGIATMAKHMGLSYGKAKQKQAQIIAYRKAKVGKK